VRIRPILDDGGLLLADCASCRGGACLRQFIAGPRRLDEQFRPALERIQAEYEGSSEDRLSNSNIDDVIQYYEKVTGSRFVKDPALTAESRCTSAEVGQPERRGADLLPPS